MRNDLNDFCLLSKIDTPPVPSIPESDGSFYQTCKLFNICCFTIYTEPEDHRHSFDAKLQVFEVKCGKEASQ